MLKQPRQPLPDRIRPASLDAFIGQAHLVGEGMPIRRMIDTDRPSSMILWGPPGVGKTTLARLIAHGTGREFYELSAVSAGKDEMRRVMAAAAAGDAPRDLFNYHQPDAPRRAPILFLDEIHRFNKAQQDYLLPHVEAGTIVLIGATTENPSFEVIAALLSRCRLFTLVPLTDHEVIKVVDRGAAAIDAVLDEEARAFLARMAAGDARQALNLLEATAALYDGVVNVAALTTALQSRHLRYDKQGEEHYNTISAFIKSMRASDPDAALHYLARLVHAGEDPKFIARRMVIFASEDVGMADVNALALANAVFRAVETIGYPECQINLAHGAVYLACAPKSRASCDGFFAALEDVRRAGDLPIPLKLRNAPTALMRQMGYGKDATPDDLSLLPELLRGKVYYSSNQEG